MCQALLGPRDSVIDQIDTVPFRDCVVAGKTDNKQVNK